MRRIQYNCTVERSLTIADALGLKGGLLHIRRSLLFRGHFTSTVKPVYKDHFRDQVIMVSEDRWSLYRGALVTLKWTMN